MFISLLLALGAFNSQNNLLFWALGFSFAAMIVSGILSGRMLMGLRATRLNSPAGHAGSVVIASYRVLNSNRRVPGFALTVRDLTVPDTESVGAKPPAAQRRSGGSPMAVIEQAGFVQHVSPRGFSDCVASIRALRRGVLPLRHVRVETSFPFGLIRKAIDFDVRGELVIWPRLLEVPAGVLRGTMQAGTSPRTPSRRRGDGDDFFSLREYSEGDSPRSIAWRVSAQRMSAGAPEQASLLVRQTVAPSPSRIWIVLDLCGDPELDERTISISASIADLAQQQGMMFGLSEPLSGLLLAPGMGRGHLERLFDALARMPLDRGPSSAGADGRASPPKAVMADGTMCIVVHGRSANSGWASQNGGRLVHLWADDPELTPRGDDAHGPPMPGSDPLAVGSRTPSASGEVMA